MFNNATSIYQQALIVLDSSFGAPLIPPATVRGTGFGTDFSNIVIYEPPITDSVGISADIESQITRTTFSNVPVLWTSALSEGYRELGEALSEMTEFEEEDEWKIEAPVLGAACFVATGLMAESFPAPKVFNHGPKSIVFNWSESGDNLYLTISADQVSALISSPERIKGRADFSMNQLADPGDALLSVRAAFLKKPVERLLPGTVSGPLELAV